MAVDREEIRRIMNLLENPTPPTREEIQQAAAEYPDADPEKLSRIIGCRVEEIFAALNEKSAPKSRTMPSRRL